MSPWTSTRSICCSSPSLWCDQERSNAVKLDFFNGFLPSHFLYRIWVLSTTSSIKWKATLLVHFNLSHTTVGANQLIIAIYTSQLIYCNHWVLESFWYYLHDCLSFYNICNVDRKYASFLSWICTARNSSFLPKAYSHFVLGVLCEGGSWSVFPSGSTSTCFLAIKIRKQFFTCDFYHWHHNCNYQQNVETVKLTENSFLSLHCWILSLSINH